MSASSDLVFSRGGMLPELEDKGPGSPVTGFLALFKRFPDDLGVEIRPFSSFV